MPISEKAPCHKTHLRLERCLSFLPTMSTHDYAYLAFMSTNQDLGRNFLPLLSPQHLINLSSNLFSSLNFILLFSAHFYNLWGFAEFFSLFSLVFMLPPNLIFSLNLISMLSPNHKKGWQQELMWRPIAPTSPHPQHMHTSDTLLCITDCLTHICSRLFQAVWDYKIPTT